MDGWMDGMNLSTQVRGSFVVKYRSGYKIYSNAENLSQIKVLVLLEHKYDDAAAVNLPR